MDAIADESSLAKTAMWRASKFTYFISILLPSANRPVFWAWYAYLRWVDDTIDENLHSRDSARAFLLRQEHLIENISGDKDADLYGSEHFLRVVLRHDKKPEKQLRKSLLDMIASIRFDADRVGQFVDEAALRRSFIREVAAFLSAVAFCCELKFEPETPPGLEAAIGAKLTHIVRDLHEDCRRSLFNITEQELFLYRIDRDRLVLHPECAITRSYIATKLRSAEELISVGLGETAKCASTRYKLIVGILAAKYQAYIDCVRRSQFALMPDAIFPWARFLGHAVRNSTRTLRSVPKTLEARRLPNPVVPISAAAHVSLRLALNRFTQFQALGALHQFARQLIIEPSQWKRLRQRFLISYVVGRCCWRYLHEGTKDKGSAHLAGLTFAFWTLTILELDRLMDEHLISDLSAKELAASTLHHIRSPEAESTNISHISAVATFNAFVLAFSHSFRDLCIRSGQPDHARRSFGECAGEFFTAQLESHAQSSDPPRDWQWYRNTLDAKTSRAFFAPLCAFAPAADNTRFELFQKYFRTLNEAYFHWQLIDDVSDFSKDTRARIVGAPGFILLSQGNLARDYLGIVTAQNAPDPDYASFQNRLIGSGLCSERFAASYQVLSSRCACHPCSALQLALCNTEADLREDVKSVSYKRAEQADAYVQALSAGNLLKAESALLASGAGDRILLACTDEGRFAEIAIHLREVNHPDLLMVLQVVEALIRREYKKAEYALEHLRDSEERASSDRNI